MSSRKKQKRVQQQERARRVAAMRRRRSLVTVIVVLAVLVVAGGVTGAIVLTRQHVAAAGQYALPRGATRDHPGLPVGHGQVDVQIYIDFMCPHCKEFETMAGSVLGSYTKDKKVRLVYHPLAFLDRFSHGTHYSTRAAAAAGCASDVGKLPQFVNGLFAKQPKENSDGLTNKQIVDAATDAGVTGGSFAHCVTSQKYHEWVSHVTNQANAKGVHQTPTVYVDGDKIDASAAALTRAVNSAL